MVLYKVPSHSVCLYSKELQLLSVHIYQLLLILILHLTLKQDEDNVQINNIDIKKIDLFKKT